MSESKMLHPVREILRDVSPTLMSLIAESERTLCLPHEWSILEVSDLYRAIQKLKQNGSVNVSVDHAGEIFNRSVSDEFDLMAIIEDFARALPVLRCTLLFGEYNLLLHWDSEERFSLLACDAEIGSKAFQHSVDVLEHFLSKRALMNKMTR